MDKIISVDLSTSTAPLVQEVRGKDYIEYGDANGEWRNLYPQFLIDLYYSSSIRPTRNYRRNEHYILRTIKIKNG